MGRIKIGKPSVLSKFDWVNGKLKHNGKTLVTESDLEEFAANLDDALSNVIASLGSSDTLVPLTLGTAYASLSVRSDWQNVPVYITDDAFHITLRADNASDGKVQLLFLTDYVSGMPTPVLVVITGGQTYTLYPTTYHYVSKDYAPGWYDANDDLCTEPPTIGGITFTKLLVGNDEYTSLDNLPAKAQYALQTLSRMVNVSTDAMGSLGVVGNGIRRLTPVPLVGQHYAFTTDRDMTFPLPSLPWSDAAQELWLDLDCTGSIELTFSDTVSYEDGGSVDTTRGKHRLHIYRHANADTWTVAETESIAEVTEDVLPEYVIPFQSVNANQLRAVLKFGYSNAYGEWCVRQQGIEQVWFRVGDTRPVTLTNGQTVTMRIIGVDYDDLPNGHKAALTCDFAEVIPITSATIAGSSTAYASSGLRVAVQNIYTLLPDWLKELTVTVRKILTGSSYVDDSIWLFNSDEVLNSGAYPIFTDATSRKRYDLNNVLSKWVFREQGRNSGEWKGITTAGAASDWCIYNSSTEFPLAVGFCLHVE